jgi:hypothetical protein
LIKKYLTLGLAVVAISLLAKAEWADPTQNAAEWTTFRAILRPVVKVYLGVFGSPVSGLLLSLLIFCVLAWLLHRLWFDMVRPARETLDRAAAAIRAAAGEVGDPVALDAMRGAMHSSVLLADSWDSFSATLIVRDHGGRPTLSATAPPADYFSLASLRAHGIDPKGFLPYSGYFVGVGLVFTFMGLVAGLYFASRGMKTADLDQARAALVALLNASTFKFATSISGILSSILMAVAVRKGVQQIERRLHVLNKALEHRAPFVTAEMLMQEQIDLLRRLDHRLASLAGGQNAARILPGGG